MSIIAAIQGISARRVHQICKEYVEINRTLQVVNKIGIPKKPLSTDDKKLSKTSHSRIHNSLFSMNLAIEGWLMS